MRKNYIKNFIAAATAILMSFPCAAERNTENFGSAVCEYAEDTSTNFYNESLSEYHIRTKEDFIQFKNSLTSNSFKNKKVYLDADIDMESEWYYSCYGENFSGYFDGQYHTISNLLLRDDDVYNGGTVAMFQTLNGTVARLNLENVDISAASFSGQMGDTVYMYDGYAGGICGTNYGEIIGCTVSGKVEIEKEESLVNLSAMDTAYCGGICAYNYGKISYCSNMADVSVIRNHSSDYHYYYGGICGYNSDGSVKNCSSVSSGTCSACKDQHYEWTHEEVDNLYFKTTTTTTTDITTTTTTTTTTSKTTTTTTTTAVTPPKLYISPTVIEVKAGEEFDLDFEYCGLYKVDVSGDTQYFYNFDHIEMDYDIYGKRQTINVKCKPDTPTGIYQLEFCGVPHSHFSPVNVTVTIKVTKDNLIGDVNADGDIDIADLVTLQRWLLGEEQIGYGLSADLNTDEKTDSFDLCLLRRKIIYGY
ncbi:MAG: dockerin type I repeat-containing protein [Ruminococcus sp.]|nr:dockerin type I repeat-containing protein [Ruminococcus sp.]